MKIAVVGAGAVGLYYGARLQKAGEDVNYLLRSDFEAIRRNGIRIRAQDTNFQLSEVKGFRDPREIGEVDLVIIAVKAISNLDLPEILAPLVGGQTVLLSLQNGLGNTEFLRRVFPSNPVFGGACYICLNRVEPGVVENYHLGSIAIAEQGNLGPELLKAVSDLFNRAGLKCRISENIDRMRWEKLLWNVPFNGLSIVAGKVTTDQILANDGLSRLARGLMEELAAAAAVRGLAIDGQLIDKLFEITKTMGEYAPSSLIDFRAGRAVEVEAIWGEPLRQALDAGLDVPKLETLYRLLRIACSDLDDN